MKSVPQRLLVVRTDRIGDVVLTIPALRALRQAFPSATIAVLVSPSTRALVEGLPCIDQVLLEDRRGFWGMWRTLLLLRSGRFEVAVIYHAKKRINLLCALAGIPVRLGFRNNKFGFLLTGTVVDDRSSSGRHEIDNCLLLLTKLGISATDRRLEIASNPADDDAADVLIKGLAGDGPLIVLHPDASCPTKRWPVGSFGALARQLQMRYHARVVIVGGSSATPSALEIEKSLGMSALDLTGKTTLGELTSLLKKTAVLVTNDSGPAHLAAALETPCVTFFLRRQDGLGPERWAPFSKRSIVLVNKPGEEIVVGPDSRVISGRYDSITVEEAYEAVSLLLSKYSWNAQDHLS